MLISVEMPAVQGCAATDCAYNIGSECHAKAITIGDGVYPGCDTYMDGAAGRTAEDGMAGVGACKLSGCAFNQDLECAAQSISVGLQSGMPACMTFTER